MHELGYVLQPVKRRSEAIDMAHFFASLYLQPQSRTAAFK